MESMLQKDTYCKNGKCAWYIIKMSAQWPIDIARNMSTIPLPLSAYMKKRAMKGEAAATKKSHQTNIRTYERTEQCPKQPILMNYKLVAHVYCHVLSYASNQPHTDRVWVCEWIVFWPNRMVVPVEEVVHIGKWHSIVLIIITIIVVHHGSMRIW